MKSTKPEKPASEIPASKTSTTNNPIKTAIEHVKNPTPESKKALTGQIGDFVDRTVNKLQSKTTTPTPAKSFSSSKSDGDSVKKKKSKKEDEEDNKNPLSKWNTHWILPNRQDTTEAVSQNNADSSASNAEASSNNTASTGSKSQASFNSSTGSASTAQRLEGLKEMAETLTSPTPELTSTPTPTPTPKNSARKDKLEKNYYSDLGVLPDAKDGEILEEAYRKVYDSMVHGDMNKAEDAILAAETLLNPETRAIHDAQLPNLDVSSILSFGR